MEGGLLEFGQRVLLDGDGVAEGAIHVVLVPLSLLVLDLRQDPVRCLGGHDLLRRQRS